MESYGWMESGSRIRRVFGIHSARRRVFWGIFQRRIGHTSAADKAYSQQRAHQATDNSRLHNLRLCSLDNATLGFRSN